MKTLLKLSLLASLTLLLSFKEKEPNKNSIIIGTYGVYDCGDKTTEKIELRFNKDQTFHYFDNNDPKNVLDIKGVWKVKGNTILLSGYNSTKSICNKWKINENQSCIKGRRGFLFMRLCNKEACGQ